MEEHIEQPLIAGRLARRVGISARHLQELFQQTSGRRRMSIIWRCG